MDFKIHRAAILVVAVAGAVALEGVLRAVPDSVEQVAAVPERDSAAHHYAGMYRISYALAVRIRHAAHKWSIPDSIAFRLVRLESEFDSAARSPASSATGLTQILVPTARAYAPTLVRADLHRVEHNLDLGFHFLHDMHRRYRNWPKALVAYRYGPAVADTAICTSYRYVRRILAP